MSDANGHLTIALGKDTYAVTVPDSFATREDIVDAWREAGESVSRSKRCYAMTVGLCVPAIAKAAKAAYAPRCDGMAFGQAIYDHLRTGGVSAAELTVAATVCFGGCYDGLFPRAEEVKGKEVFTEAPAEHPT